MNDLLKQYQKLGTFEVLHPQDARDIGDLLASFGYFRYGDMLHKYADEIDKINNVMTIDNQ